MGNLKYYYDKIILNQFQISKNETKNFLLNDWDFSNLEQTEFYQEISNNISQQFKILYSNELHKQIIIVIKSLRRIINKPEEISEQFAKLLDINANLPAQRSPEWHKFREDMITASTWGNVLGMIGSQREVLLQKLGHEKSQFKGNEFTRWGTKYEPVATSIYEKRQNKKIFEFGCMRHPDPDNFFLGASPDGIADDGIMLEIKCPPKRKIGPIPPDYYWAQMQGQLEVCDLEQCDFLECKLLEYESQEDYENDINVDKTFSKEMESGVVLTFKNLEGNDEFFYSKFFLKGDEFNDWMFEHIQEYQQKQKWRFMGPSFWYLAEYQCNPVFRDKEWFTDAREKLKQFYDLWQFYKKHGYESLLTERNIKPSPSNIPDNNLQNFEGFVIKDDVADEEIFIKNCSGFSFKNPEEYDDDTTIIDEMEQKLQNRQIGFAFGKTTTTTEKPKIGFAFGKSNTTAEKPKMGFAFGKTTTTAEKPKMGFGFGKSNTIAETKPKMGFAFGKTTTAETKTAATKIVEKPKMGFAFGKSNTTAETKPKMGFAFGKGKSVMDEDVKIVKKTLKKKTVEEKVEDMLTEDEIPVLKKFGFS